MIAFSNSAKPSDPTGGSANHSDSDVACNRLELGWLELILVCGWAVIFCSVKFNLFDTKPYLVTASGDFFLKPLICYSFIHLTWTGIVLSLAILLCFGQVARRCLSMPQAIRVYVLGIVIGGIVYVLVSRQFSPSADRLSGATAALIALLGASVAIAPNQRVSILGDSARRLLYRLFIRNKHETVISPIWILAVVAMLVIGMVKSLGFVLTAQLDIFVYAMFPLRVKWILVIWLGMRGVALLFQTFVLKTEITGESIAFLATVIIAFGYGALERGFQRLRVGDAPATG